MYVYGQPIDCGLLLAGLTAIALLVIVVQAVVLRRRSSRITKLEDEALVREAKIEDLKGGIDHYKALLRGPKRRW